MNSPQLIYAMRWLVGDTFRQALATRIFWIMLVVSALAIIFCLGVSVEGGENLRPEGDFLYHPKTNEPFTGATRDLGELRLCYGAFKVSLARDRQSGVHLIHVILASWVAGAIGLLATLIWTAGFIPEALQPGNAAVVFTKPVPRWFVLVGRYLGVVLFVALQAAIFFAGTWLALGIRTNVWLYGYLAGIPLLVLQFAALFSVSVFIAVCTRSTMACILGSVLFWILCLAVNYARDAAVALPQIAPDSPSLPPLTSTLMDATYWILPKPADFIMMLEHALDARTHMATLSSVPEFAAAIETGKVDFAASLFTTMLFPIVLLVCAGRQLGKVDY
jgi:ABC-type transport system involved in multi-copper enzyme maturation permease subunit